MVGSDKNDTVNAVFNEFDGYQYKRDKNTGELLEVPAEGQPDHAIDATRYVLIHRGTRWDVPKKNA